MKALRMFITVAALACASIAHAQPRQRGFSVILLVGETQGTASVDSQPAVVRKALNDVKDFLPYKSYRVIDTQWLQGGVTRMRGLDNQEYDVEVVDVA